MRQHVVREPERRLVPGEAGKLVVPLSDQITALVAEIFELDSARDKVLKSLEGEGLLSQISEQHYQTNRWKFKPLEDLNRSIDLKRQKLISLQLASINDYSDRMNQNIAR